MDTKQEIEDMMRSVAQREADDIANDTFRAKFLWVDEENLKGSPRLIMFPDMEPTHESRARLGWALRVLSSTTNAEKMVFIVDTCHTKSKTKKDGTPWELGEMQHALRNSTENADLIMEGLSYQVADKDGWLAMAMLPYRRTKHGIQFIWDDVEIMIEDVDEPNASLGGIICDIMREAMVTPKILEYANEQFGFDVANAIGLDIERRNMHTLAAGVKTVMTQTGFACGIPAYSKVEAEILERSFEGIGDFIKDEDSTDN